MIIGNPVKLNKYNTEIEIKIKNNFLLSSLIASILKLNVFNGEINKIDIIIMSIAINDSFISVLTIHVLSSYLLISGNDPNKIAFAGVVIP